MTEELTGEKKPEVIRDHYIDVIRPLSFSNDPIDTISSATSRLASRGWHGRQRMGSVFGIARHPRRYQLGIGRKDASALFAIPRPV
jgi:hypothetical protein